MMFELSVIIGAAFYLSRFPPLLIKITKGFILLTALSILSYYYFKLTGTFLNVSFALAAMGFHDIVMSIEKAVIQRKQTDQKH
jgi:hypothetical protein